MVFHFFDLTYGTVNIAALSVSVKFSIRSSILAFLRSFACCFFSFLYAVLNKLKTLFLLILILQTFPKQKSGTCDIDIDLGIV